MNSLAFVILARDSGIGLHALVQDIRAVARPGDQVLIVDDGDDGGETARWAGRAMAMTGLGAGVAVSRIVTGTRAPGDAGLAANLARDRIAADLVLFLPGAARLVPAGVDAARALATQTGALLVLCRWAMRDADSAQALPLPADPQPAPHLSALLMARSLLDRLPRHAEGQPGGSNLPVIRAAAALAAAEGRLERADDPLGTLPPWADAPADWLHGGVQALPDPADRAWLAAHSPWRIRGAGHGAACALAPALETLGLPSDRAALRKAAAPHPAPPRIGSALLQVARIGRHARRMPLSYPDLAPLWQDRVALTDDAACADLVLLAHPVDLMDLTRPEAAALDRRTCALFSEEPFWDTLFSPDPLARRVVLRAAHLGGLAVHQVNHHRSAVFDFDRIPYFLLTEHRYAESYARLFSRNAALSAQDWLAAFANRPMQAAFMAERRPEAFHDLRLPGGDVTGLCAWRTRLAEAYRTGRVERLGASWHGGPTRFDLPDWHGDKIERLDGQTRFLSAVENTHQPAYLSEKLFDAFACGARPLYVASPWHRVHDLGLPAEAWVNLWGLDSAAAPVVIDAAAWDGGFAAAYAAAQASLAALFTDPAILAAERARLGAAVWDELIRLEGLGPA